MSSRQTTYRALLGIALLAGVVAIGFSLFGVYTALTGGTTTDEGRADVLGSLECAAFDGDPDLAHATDYAIERTLRGGSELKAFNATSTPEGLRIEATTEGRLLEASARRADGTNVTVRTFDGENRLVVEQEDGTPFRLWIDTIGDESTITRTRLDVCP
ncbi:MAG: hypothetical protein V5A34_02765 [Halapricum sp.]